MVTNSQSVNHGLEAQVDLAAANDLSDIRRVVWLEQGHFDSFVFEVAFRLGEVKRSVVWRGMPCKESFSIAREYIGSTQRGVCPDGYLISEPTSW